MDIEHISLDFWNTVGRPNPKYSAQRARFLADFFNTSEDEARRIYTEVKTLLDDAAETRGASTPRVENISALHRGFGKVNITQDYLGQIFDELFRNDPPFIDEDIRRACRRANQMGVTLSIGSNTNFIRGEQIRQQLSDIPFGFMLFSDEAEISKPHRDFFNRIWRSARSLNLRVNDPGNVLHIGDHPVCDGKATESGLQFRLVENHNTATIINEVLDRL